MLKTKYTSPTLIPEKMITKNVAKLGRIFATLDIKVGKLSFLGFFSSHYKFGVYVRLHVTNSSSAKSSMTLETLVEQTVCRVLFQLVRLFLVLVLSLELLRDSKKNYINQNSHRKSFYKITFKT
jgi:hypothetical protein